MLIPKAPLARPTLKSGVMRFAPLALRFLCVAPVALASADTVSLTGLVCFAAGFSATPAPYRRFSLVSSSHSSFLQTEPKFDRKSFSPSQTNVLKSAYGLVARARKAQLFKFASLSSVGFFAP